MGTGRTEVQTASVTEFLASDPETKEVIWVCPSSSRHTAPFQPITDRMKQLVIS